MNRNRRFFINFAVFAIAFCTWMSSVAFAAGAGGTGACGTLSVRNPADEMTVGEVLVLTVQMYGTAQNDASVDTLSLDGGDYAAYTAYAREHGLMPDKNYASYDVSISRLDAMEFFSRALPWQEFPIINPQAFVPDLSADHPLYDAVCHFYRAGILVGVNGSGFCPEKPLLAAEAEAIATRMVFPEYRQTVSIQPVQPQRQAYMLSVTHSMNGAKEGIQSGWQLDNRAGVYRTNSGNNSTLSDIKTDEKSRLIRHFNRITDDTLEIRVRVAYQVGFDGNVIELCDADDSPTYRMVTSGGAFCIQNRDGSLTEIYTPKKQLSTFTFRIIADLSTGVATTAINNEYCGESQLTGRAVKYFAVSTSDETKNLTNLGASYMFANYAVHEDLNLTSEIPYDFTASGSVSVKNEEFTLNRGAVLSKDFDAVGGKTVFAFNAFLPSGTAGSTFSITSAGKPIVTFTAENGKLYANGTALKQIPDKLWYKLRAELDPYSGTAVIKVNAKVLATVPFLTQTLTFDGVRFENQGNTSVKLDDIQVFGLTEYYVPEPVIPEGADDYIIGLNICSLWVNGDHFGWGCTTPYEDLRPVLDYYDEGLPESADWENKFMADHGIDFQAFCWYANQSNAPMKSTRLAAQLDDAYLHSKYGDSVKFCLLWEAANASRPANSEAFRNYYVPYWIENYFTDPRYMTIDNKLVFSIFGADKLISDFGTGLKAEFDYMREEVKKLGFDGMIITASHTGVNNLEQYGFDAWQAYNWGNSGYSANTNISSNTSTAGRKDVYVIPTVSVGFNSIAWHGKRYPLMTTEDYRSVNEWIRDTYLPRYADPNSWNRNVLWLSTWNEYGEGTYIMPADKLNGFGYLDVLRDVYTTADPDHSDPLPTAEQKTHFNHLYPQDFRLLRAYGDYTGIPGDSFTYDENKVLSFCDFTVSGNHTRYVTRSNMSSYVQTTANGTTFRSSATNPDAILNIRSAAYSGLTCNDIAMIRVVASGIPKGQHMQLFYQTDGAPDLSEINSIRAESMGTSEMAFDFPVAAQKGWSGSIRNLRLDPLQIVDTAFTIKSISFFGKTQVDRPNLYINGEQVANVIIPELDENGVWYFPFEPGRSFIDQMLYVYFEWDYDTKTLKLYRDGKCAAFRAGSDKALVDGKSVALGGTVYLRDNIPMLPIEGLAAALGFGCEYVGKDYYYTTPEADIFEGVRDDIKPDEWNFNMFGSSSGWNGGNMGIGFGDGTLLLTSENNDPMIYSPTLEIDCSKYRKIEIRCRWNMTNSATNTMGFYFITQADSNWNQAKYQGRNIVRSTNDFQTLTFDMSVNNAWQGTLTQLRFDPFNANGTCEVDYIKLIP